jgi:tRNA dimethylallyltransferase
MAANVFRNALILTGPTGSGKTTLGLRQAERLGAEIVSMDSMAIYRGMDIGTAKPTAEERQRVPHHLISVLDPWEPASVAWWLDQAARACRNIESRGKRPFFVGGTALYLKALLCGLFDGPSADETLRRRLEEEANLHGPVALHFRLARVDPASASRLHPNDVRRIIRALEVWELTSKPISAWQAQWRGEGQTGKRALGETDPAGPYFAAHPVAFWINLPRMELYARINVRVQRMFDSGFVAEAEALRRLPRPVGKEAAQALGYREVFAYLDGKATLEDTIFQVQTRSRQFAKRQLTWFRRLPQCRPVGGELTETEWERTIQAESVRGQRGDG